MMTYPVMFLATLLEGMAHGDEEYVNARSAHNRAILSSRIVAVNQWSNSRGSQSTGHKSFLPTLSVIPPVN